MKKEYKYFVSYNYERGFGNIEIIRDKPIENMDEIITLSRGLEKHYGFEENSLVIITFQLFN